MISPDAQPSSELTLEDLAAEVGALKMDQKDLDEKVNVEGQTEAQLQAILEARFSVAEVQFLKKRYPSLTAGAIVSIDQSVPPLSQGTLSFTSILSESGAPLLISSPVGLSHTGWVAVLAAPPSHAHIRLYYERITVPRPAEFRAKRCPKLPDFSSDSITCASIYDSSVVLWNEETRVAYLVDMSTDTVTENSCLASVLQSEARATSVSTNGTDFVLSFALAAQPFVVCVRGGSTPMLISEIGVKVKPEAAYVPKNPYTGLPLQRFEEAEVLPTQYPTCSCFDQFNPSRMFLGTNGGLIVEPTFLPTGKVVYESYPWDMGTAPECEDRDSQHKTPGLEAIMGFFVRGTTAMSIMPHSFSARDDASLSSMLQDVPQRLGRIQYRDSPPTISVGFAGQTYIAYYATGGISVGHFTPSACVPVDIAKNLHPPLKCGAPYSACYIDLTFAAVLLADGRLAFLRSSIKD